MATLSAPVTSADPALTVTSKTRTQRWALLLGVGALLAVALALRLAFLVRSGWLLEGDDSLSTLMALAILEGDRPIMLKNQTYAGAWEPYAMAASYALFGISRVSAKLPGLVASLALIGAVWLLAREVAGPVAARFAALLSAVPPVYVLVMHLRPWAPYTEVMLLGTLALWCAVRLAFPRGAHQRDGWWAFGCGTAGGLAFWLHPLAVYYLLPAAAVVLLRLRGRRLVGAVAHGGSGFLLGAGPFWLYNLQTGGATLRFFLAGAGGQSADRGAVLAAWWHKDLPRAVGLWQPWGATPEVLALAVGVIVALAVAWAVLVRPWRRPALRPLDGVLLLLLSIPAVFTLSGFGGPALNEWGFDATGRYAPPIWTGLAATAGAFLAAVWRWRRVVAAALGAVLVAANLYAWSAADPVLAFQSPYWPKLPVDNRLLLELLAQEQVEHVWVNHWAGQPLMFDARAAGQRLVAYDWYDVQAGGIDRFPEYRPLVEQAARPAFVLITDEAEPELERRLRALGVAYTRRDAAPYVVIIPEARRVHPSEVTAALDYRY